MIQSSLPEDIEVGDASGVYSGNRGVCCRWREFSCKKMSSSAPPSSRSSKDRVEIPATVLDEGVVLLSVTSDVRTLRRRYSDVRTRCRRRRQELVISSCCCETCVVPAKCGVVPVKLRRSELLFARDRRPTGMVSTGASNVCVRGDVVATPRSDEDEEVRWDMDEDDD